MLTLTQPSMVYVVYRLNWRGFNGFAIRVPGERRMAAFADEATAKEDCLRREAEVRARLNPFRLAPKLVYLSSFPLGIYLDWLRDADLDPPVVENDVDDLAAWWDGVLPTLTAFQRDRVWQGLDRIRFFEVRAIDPARCGYAVVARQWNYNDNWYETTSEGGRPVQVFRTWERAERHRQLLERAMRDRVQNERFIVCLDFRDESQWPFPGEERTAIVTDVDHAFYDIVEIDLCLEREATP